MCGIAGYLETGTAGHGAGAVRSMCAALAHRGPDAEGVQTLGPMTLGHRRLSIIDLSAEGNQPLPNEDGSVVVVVNGEIYNYQKLRQQLIASGHRFRSKSDSEIVAHLYEEVGDALVDQLRGMFAFALWDARRQRLLLGRDRLGKKPLYWTQRPEGFAFASELPALLAGLPSRPAPDLDAIDRYLTLQYVPAPLTAFQGVHKLPPGHVLSLERRGEPKLRRYWRLSFAPRTARVSHKQAVEESRALLEEAVSLRMVADVPVGAFLSGGVDSSAVVAMMAREAERAGAGPVKTFSIDFPGGAGEVEYARMVAERYRTDHHEMKVEPDMVGVVHELVGRYGEPFADTSAVPVYYLSKMTREHVKVVLSGDGGDETFAGYRRYLWQSLGDRARRLPGPVWRAAAGWLSRLRAPRRQPFRDFGRYLDRPPAERYLSFVAHFASLDKPQLRGPALAALRGDGADPVLLDFERRMSAVEGDDDINRLLSLDTETYLADDILTKVDIASMAHALEVRAPLVDHVLMERMASLPGRLKLRGFQGKRLLRAAVADLVPAPILGRRKKGFSLPIDRWFRGELRPMARDLLGDRTCRERGLVNPAEVTKLLDEQDQGASHGERLWNLVILELWCRQFVDGRATASAGRVALGGRVT